MLNRRDFLKAGALPGVGLAGAPRRPNVLFIVSDQLHHATPAKTPALDRLASEGVRFTHALCATPFCSPTRASFMTGVYPHAHRIVNNGTQLDPRLPTTEQALFEAGYTCRQFGKWHLGDRGLIPAYKDQPASGYRDGEDTPRRKRGEKVGRNGLPVVMAEAVGRANRQYDGSGAPNTVIGRIDLAPEKMIESRIADEAIQEIGRLAGKPFFVTVSLPAPHAPWEIGEPYYSLHPRARIALPANRHSIHSADRQTAAFRFGQLLGEDGMREYLGVYYGLVSMVDWNVGRLLETLRRHSLERDTLVVFTADHGDMQGGHGCYDKTTFSMYEETTRVPLIVRFPGRIRAGKQAATPAGSCDISPTILDYLGVKPRFTPHGVSLRPYLEGREDLQRSIFCERERGERNFQRLIRTLEWKYSYASTGASQLYHIAKDPGETNNLIDQPSARAVQADLHARLARWMRETGDPRKLP
ncbi:MAG: sulfatase-like hydrolase/transferase [Acidobacteriota bacterium]